MELLQNYINNSVRYNLSDCELSYPVFYINMDKDVKRRNYVESNLKKISKKFQRVKGFNGYAIKDRKHDVVDGIEFVNSYKIMTKPEIGCMLSHLLAIQKARDSGEDIVMICEDDIMLDMCSLIPSLENVVKNAPEDWEILQLCSGVKDANSNDIKPLPAVEYVKRTQNTRYWSCVCYLINRKGMDKVMTVTEVNKSYFSISPTKEVDGIMFPSEGISDTYIYDIANTYSVFPNLFFPNNFLLDSTIHTDHTLYHIDLTVKSIKKLLGKKYLSNSPKDDKYIAKWDEIMFTPMNNAQINYSTVYHDITYIPEK